MSALVVTETTGLVPAEAPSELVDPHGDCGVCGYPRWRPLGHAQWCGTVARHNSMPPPRGVTHRRHRPAGPARPRKKPSLPAVQ